MQYQLYFFLYTVATLTFFFSGNPENLFVVHSSNPDIFFSGNPDIFFAVHIGNPDIFSVATLTYLLIGAAIFDKIESGEEQNQAVALKSNHHINK